MILVLLVRLSLLDILGLRSRLLILLLQVTVGLALTMMLGPSSSRDRAVPNDLQRDFVFGTATRTFNVDLANGIYQVTVTIGDSWFAHDIIDVFAEDVLMMNDLTVSAGSFNTQAFLATVSDGQLNLRIADAGGANPNWVINGMSIQRV